MGLALLAGVILGLRFRIGRVLLATVALLSLALGVRLDEGNAPLVAIVCAAVLAALMQTVALLVLFLKGAFVEGRA